MVDTEVMASEEAAGQSRGGRNRAEAAGAAITLGPQDQLIGKLVFHGDVRLQGAMEGELTLAGDFTVDADASAKVKLESRNLSVRGKFEGEAAVREPAREHQVLCVSHLAQVAAYADTHVKVRKEVRGGRTHVIAERLGTKDSATELAEMLGAGGSSKSLAAGARELQSGAAQDVMLGDLERAEFERAERLDEQHCAGDDRGRAVGVQTRHVAALVVGHRGQAVQQLLGARDGHAVAVDALGVVRVELDPPGLDLGPDVTIGEEHPGNLSGPVRCLRGHRPG